jgi:zinc transport system ATP-binding protein
VKAIEFKNVSVSLSGKTILENVSFEVPQRSFTLVFGPNGAGKSTLLKLLTRGISPQKGEILLFGQPLRKEGPIIGYVPQDYSTLRDFPMTVEKAVLSGRYGRIGLFHWPTRTDHSVVERCLEEAGIKDLKGRHLSQLSGGEFQRMLIARALASDPSVLLLDEASSAVDAAARESLFSLLTRLKERMTILLVTHDMGAITKSVDAVLCLNRTLVSHGRPEDALHESALECMYGKEAHLFTHCRIPHVHVHHHEED